MKETVELPTLMTQEELAEYLGMSTAWCERSRWDGTGPRYLKLGGKRLVRYRAEDVKEWLDESMADSEKQERKARRSSRGKRKSAPFTRDDILACAKSRTRTSSQKAEVLKEDLDLNK